MTDDTPAPVAQPLTITDIFEPYDEPYQDKGRCLVCGDDGLLRSEAEAFVTARSVPDCAASPAGPEYPMALVLHRHEYDLRCRLCGLAGQVRVSVEPEGEDPRD